LFSKIATLGRTGHGEKAASPFAPAQVKQIAPQIELALVGA
jgi:hypothetical protein